MGQYFLYANLTSREFFAPDALGPTQVPLQRTEHSGRHVPLADGRRIRGRRHCRGAHRADHEHFEQEVPGAASGIGLGRWAGAPTVPVGEYANRTVLAALLPQKRRREFQPAKLRERGKLPQPVPPMGWIRSQ